MAAPAFSASLRMAEKPKDEMIKEPKDDPRFHRAHAMLNAQPEPQCGEAVALLQELLEKR